MPPNPRPLRNPAGAKPLNGKAWLHHLILILTLATAVGTWFCPAGAIENLDALLLVLATAGSISALARQLPLQSVLFAAFITALIGATAHGLSARTGIPMGPLSFGESVGPQLFNTVPWSVGFIWIITVFNSRGVARLILRPWRKVRNYGFLLIATTAGLSLVFDLALEPFAHLKHFWLWQPTKIHVTWYWATPVSFLGWIFVTLIILAVIMPYLIRKQPGSPSQPDYTPLALWLGAIVLFAVSMAQAAYWPALILDAAAAVVVAILSWRGARW